MTAKHSGKGHWCYPGYFDIDRVLCACVRACVRVHVHSLVGDKEMVDQELR